MNDILTPTLLLLLLATQICKQTKRWEKEYKRKCTRGSEEFNLNAWSTGRIICWFIQKFTSA